MTQKPWYEIIVLIVSLFFTALLSSLFLNTIIKHYYIVRNSDSGNYMINAIVTQFIMFGGTTFLFLKATGSSFNDFIKFRKPSKFDVVHVLICFAIAITITIAFSPLSELIQSHFPDHSWVLHQLEVTRAQSAVLGDFRGAKLPIAILVFAAVPAIFEELVFRGVLYRILKGVSGKKNVAIVLSAIIFSLIHFQILSFIPITIVGILLAYLYEKTDNLLNPMILHFAFNAIQIIIWQA